MKKSLHLLTCATVLALAVTGCKTRTAQSAADSTDSAMAAISAAANDLPDTLTTDSAVYNKVTKDVAECHFHVDYPTGSDALAQAVKAAIVKELADLYLPLVNAEDKQRKDYPIYKGSTDKAQNMTDFYGAGTMKYLSELHKSLQKDLKKMQAPTLYNYTQVRKVADAKKYVTYSFSNGCFLGGAHGSFVSYNLTISKCTHKTLDQTVDTTRVNDLQKLLRQGIVSYFHECGQTDVNDKNLNDGLFLPDESKGLIPLPATTPWFTKNGVCFAYQQYEIAPYAAGVITFNIPYNKIKPYLTKEAKDLIE